jgi:hypothetical protein
MHVPFRLPLLAALLVVAALFVRGPAQPVHAYPGSDNLNVQAACNYDGTVQIRIAWNTYGAGPQWLDFSLYNNGFAPGTFVGIGPANPSVNQVTWTGILNSTTYYLRLNTQTATAWYPSETVGFTTTPCPVMPAPVVIPAPIFVPVPIFPVLPPPPPIPIPGPIPPTPSGPTQPTPPGPTPMPPGPSQLPSY